MLFVCSWMGLIQPGPILGLSHTILAGRQNERKREGKDIHVMMFSQFTEILIQFLDSFLVGFCAFAFETVLKL